LGWGLKLCLKLLVILWILTVVQVFLLRFVDPPFTAMMGWNWLQNKITTKHNKLPDYHWRQLKEISPHLIKAVLAGEDQRFLTHHGFDFIEMNQAVQDIITDRRIRGASTITMQLARTVFLWPDRNWLRKIAEAYYTVLIEILWDKKRILEIYLNTVDWGTGKENISIRPRRVSPFLKRRCWRLYFHDPTSGLPPNRAGM